MNTDFVQVAIEVSNSIDIYGSDSITLISKLSEEEKNAFLVGFLQNKPDLNIKLKKRLQDFVIPKKKVSSYASRTVAQLRKESEKMTKLRQEEIEKEKLQARIKELQHLARKEFAIWQEVNNSIQSKTQTGYKNATKLLHDLQELAIYQDKMVEIRKEYSRLSSFMRRLYECELIE